MLIVPQDRDATAPAIAEDHTTKPVPRPTISRRRALTAAALLGGLLAILWLGDALSGIVPKGAYMPPPQGQGAGPYTVALTLDAANPAAGNPLHARLAVTDAASHPVTGATVTYRWEMVTMDMGTNSGTATPDKQQGAYDTTVSALMGGYWRLTVTIHTTSLPDGTTSFDVPVRA